LRGRGRVAIVVAPFSCWSGRFIEKCSALDVVTVFEYEEVQPPMLHSEQGAGDTAEAAQTREEEVVLRGAVAHSIGEDTNHLPNVILSEEAFAAVDEVPKRSARE